MIIYQTIKPYSNFLNPVSHQKEYTAVLSALVCKTLFDFSIMNSVLTGALTYSFLRHRSIENQNVIPRNHEEENLNFQQIKNRLWNNINAQNTLNFINPFSSQAKCISVLSALVCSTLFDFSYKYSAFIGAITFSVLKQSSIENQRKKNDEENINVQFLKMGLRKTQEQMNAIYASNEGNPLYRDKQSLSNACKCFSVDSVVLPKIWEFNNNPDGYNVRLGILKDLVPAEKRPLFD
jgi:hypothetical protein